MTWAMLASGPILLVYGIGMAAKSSQGTQYTGQAGHALILVTIGMVSI
jgi:hypothetical protein